jgi:hypothetical protein
VLSLALHPGISGTDLMLSATGFGKQIKEFVNWVFKTNEEAAQTTIYLAFEARDKLIQGGYYDDCHPASTLSASLSERQALWALAEEATGGAFL